MRVGRLFQEILTELNKWITVDIVTAVVNQEIIAEVLKHALLQLLLALKPHQVRVSQNTPHLTTLSDH